MADPSAISSRQLRHRSENYNDPKLPTYRPEWWRPSVEHWYKTLDWCGFLDDITFKDLYLRKVPGEFKEDRDARLMADSPEPFFKDAVNDHASIFTQFEIAENAPESLIAHKDNVDLQGSDLHQWAKEPIAAFFRDGGALLGCDIDRNPTVGDRRPRLTWIPLRDVFWVEYRDYDGVSVLSRLAIRRSVNVFEEKKGLQLKNQYWAYELDESQRCLLTVWQEDKDNKLVKASFTGSMPDGSLVETESIELRDASDNPLTQLPFTDKLSAIGNLNLDDERVLMSFFADLLSLNCEHYNAKSEYNAVKCKTALPTPIRYWENGVPKEIPPFYAGSGKTQDYSAGSRVEYLELTGASLPLLRQSLMDLEEKLARRDNKLFSAVSGRSATEAEIENQKSKVGLPGIKSIIESAFQDVFAIWELLANPTPQEVGGIIIGDDVLKTPPNPQDMLPYLNAIDKGVPASAAINAMVRVGVFEASDFEESVVAIDTPDPLPTNPDEVIQ